MGQEPELVQALARVTGRVQGVYFRASTQEHARALGLRGWVRNLPDGRVELRARGTRPRVEALLEWCRKGPPDARVDNLEYVWETPDTPLPATFAIFR